MQGVSRLSLSSGNDEDSVLDFFFFNVVATPAAYGSVWD